MSNYSKADRTSQWFQDDYPGADLNLTARTAVVVLHTTETRDWPGYQGGATAPNYTHKPSVEGSVGGWRAHFPDEKSSRALRNQDGGVQTNTLNCIQVELIGTCDPKNRRSWGGAGKYLAGRDYVFWPDANEAQLKAVAAFLADLNKRHRLQLVAPKRFLSYPESGGNSPVRMSFEEWRNAVGIVGHQHVPENSHGDPGSLDITRILEYAMDIVTGRTTPALQKPLTYTVTKKKPEGKEYHGPGSAKSAAGLRRYHETNSLKGVRKAKALGFPKVDIDVMLTKDLVLVVNHSFDAMGKEGFRADGVPRKPIDQLTWEEVSKLRAPDGTRIQKLSTILDECAKLGIWAMLDLKGDAREGWRILKAMGRITRIANNSHAKVALKCDPKKRKLREALTLGRKLGFWARYNGSPTLLRPL